MSLFNRIPVATYRLQMNAGFTFEQARELLDYLQQLGMSDLYLSPIMRAREGSDHGYDTVDPTTINPVLGGQDAFDRLAASAATRGIGILLDIVPNHMAASSENRWWWNALCDGPECTSGAVFDIYWDADGKALLPVLGDHYANVLERDELGIAEDAGAFVLTYFDNRFPLNVDQLSRSTLARYRNTDDPETRRELLDQIIGGQHYRLGYWRTASREINYRRFFDINELVALRMEDGEAFGLIHDSLAQLAATGKITGLRIDHIDGLRDPLAYLQRLQEHVYGNEASPPIYVAVEKILTGDENLPDDWPVAGTSGYDFLNMSSAALTSTVGLQRLIEITSRFAADEAEFDRIVHQAKYQVIDELFAADLSRLVVSLGSIARSDRYGRDLIGDELRSAIREMTACMPVYRTYVASTDVSPIDKRVIEQVSQEALDQRPGLQVAIRFLRRVLLLEDWKRLERDDLNRRIDFVARWQQFTGPVMAKGLEDTTLYRDPTLLSANAVGGERDAAEASVDDFHAWAQRRAERWPHTMNATSTHDSKRSEDIRARIAVLSELPGEWEAAFESWREATAADVRSVDGLPVPDGRGTLFLFQTLLGSWPLQEGDLSDYPERLQSYAVKAEREAKLQTSWLDVNQTYEAALQAFIDDLFDNQQFLNLSLPFQQHIAFHGMLNSLSSTLLKITSPGLPDFYQGTELWDFSLVDPDNRRPVDFDLRARMLQDVMSAPSPAQLVNDWRSGQIKLYLIWKSLQIRASNRGLFEQGNYIPLVADGEHARHVIAFARASERAWAITMVPRLTAMLAIDAGRPLGQLPLGLDVWNDTSIILPDDLPAAWSDVFTSRDVRSSKGRIRVGDILRDFPAGLLVAER